MSFIIRQRLQELEREQRDLAAAAKIQASFLPAAAPRVPGAEFAWCYRPCDELAANATRSPPPVASSVASPLTSRLFINTGQFTALACTESAPAQGTAER